MKTFFLDKRLSTVFYELSNGRSSVCCDVVNCLFPDTASSKQIVAYVAKKNPKKKGFRKVVASSSPSFVKVPSHKPRDIIERKFGFAMHTRLCDFLLSEGLLAKDWEKPSSSYTRAPLSGAFYVRIVPFSA